MGREIIKLEASQLLASPQSAVNSQNADDSDEIEEHSMKLLEAEVSLDYLCNLSPHRLELLNTMPRLKV